MDEILCPYCSAPVIMREQGGTWYFCRNCLSYRTPVKHGERWLVAPHARSRAYLGPSDLYQYEGLTGIEWEIINGHAQDTSQPSMDPKILESLAIAYGSGTSIASLAKSYSMSRHTISGLLKGLGFSVKRGRPPGKNVDI